MSRVGNAPIQIPSGVTVETSGQEVRVSGPKGQLQMVVEPQIKVNCSDVVVIERKSDDKKSASLHGLTRSLVNNMVVGVSEGWAKDLELVGVGFRVTSSGDKLNLIVGFSHPVEIVAPEGIRFEVLENTKIRVLGIDKYLVGQTAANIKKVRVPDVYKGKGIRYQGERIRKKPGKAGKVTGKI